MNTTVAFSELARKSALPLVRAGLDEDLRQVGDLTSLSLIAADATAAISVVARESGVVSGLPIAEMVFAELDTDVDMRQKHVDGSSVASGTIVAEFSGPLRSLLTGERTALNFLTHLSGIASLTARFAKRVEGTQARILDTRKTLPAYRLLHKYAVACGGGTNHRMGLYDGVLIKDNHLAAWATRHSEDTNVAAAVVSAREFVQGRDGVTIEVEVDTLEQFIDAIRGQPDIVLLDNMTNDQLREAVAIRDRNAPGIQLEASGGVNLDTVRGIAETGVDRISIGALTHSAASLDLAFDWKNRIQNVAQ